MLSRSNVCCHPGPQVQIRQVRSPHDSDLYFDNFEVFDHLKLPKKFEESNLLPKPANATLRWGLREDRHDSDFILHWSAIKIFESTTILKATLGDRTIKRCLFLCFRY